MLKRIQMYGTMLSPEAAAAKLKKAGSRMTAQRKAVLDILYDNRTHPTAEALISQVQEKLGFVSIATIYNTLESLVELGFVRRINGLEQRARFDPDTSDHGHAICRKCKKVWDVDSPSTLPDLPDNFQVEDILIQGVCVDCAND